MSNKNELNELSKKLKAISKKGLTKDLIDQFSIINGAIFIIFIFVQEYFRNIICYFYRL